MKKIKKYLIPSVVILVVVFGIFKLLTFLTTTEEHTYNLSEIENGVYVMKYDSVSSIPSKNFTIAECCVNDILYKVCGDITIKYTTGKPYVELVLRPNMVDGNSEATFYIPKGSVVTNESVSVGTRGR